MPHLRGRFFSFRPADCAEFSGFIEYFEKDSYSEEEGNPAVRANQWRTLRLHFRNGHEGRNLRGAAATGRATFRS